MAAAGGLDAENEMDFYIFEALFIGVGFYLIWETMSLVDLYRCRR